MIKRKIHKSLSTENFHSDGRGNKRTSWKEREKRREERGRERKEIEQLGC